MLFQDYNEEVTVVLLKKLLESEMDESKFRIFYGAWEDLLSSIVGIKFDVIVASEILYNADNYSVIIEIIRKHLYNDGCAYVASKNMYFGLSGDIFTFSALASENGLGYEIYNVESENIPRSIIKLYLL